MRTAGELVKNVWETDRYTAIQTEESCLHWTSQSIKAPHLGSRTLKNRAYTTELGEES